MERHDAGKSRSISRTKMVIFSILPVLVLLAIGELGLRVWAYYFRTSYERYNTATGRLELVPGIRFTTRRGHEFLINPKGFLGPDFAEKKPEGVYRIFAVGDSCTFGAGLWKLNYPAILQERLAAEPLGRRVEVINAGIEGYNSEFALGRIQSELLRYEPDMVILYIGWNDLMKVDPHNPTATGRYAWLARAMETSYLFKAYSKVMFYHLRPLLMKPGLAATDAAIFDAYVPQRFVDNLQSMIAALRSRGVMPLLVTLPTVVTPTMDHEGLKRQHVFFPYYPGAYSVGGFLSLHAAYNRAIRSIAGKERAPLVDLDAAFKARDRSRLFWDTMHPSEQGHALVADTLAQTVKGFVK